MASHREVGDGATADDSLERLKFELGVTSFGAALGAAGGGKTGAVIGGITAYGWGRSRWRYYR